jgi:hypothetical protein
MEDTPQQTYDELLAALTADAREKVLAGVLTVHQGQSRSKPVLRDAATRALAKGTGRAPKAHPPELASQAAVAVSYKRTKSYQEAMDLLMSVDAGPDVKGSYAWLYDKAMWAAQGAPQEVKEVCPHWYPVDEEGEPMCARDSAGNLSCRKHDHSIPPCQDPLHTARVVVQRPDGVLIFKLLELKHGRAKETVEVTGQVDHFVTIMEARETPFLVYDVSPDEEAARTAAVAAVIDGDFREVDENEPSPAS